MFENDFKSLFWQHGLKIETVWNLDPPTYCIICVMFSFWSFMMVEERTRNLACANQDNWPLLFSSVLEYEEKG